MEMIAPTLKDDEKWLPIHPPFEPKPKLHIIKKPPWRVYITFGKEYDVTGTIYFKNLAPLPFVHHVRAPPPEFKVNHYSGSNHPNCDTTTQFQQNVPIPISKSKNRDFLIEGQYRYWSIRSDRDAYAPLSFKITIFSGDPTNVVRAYANGKLATSCICTKTDTPGNFNLVITSFDGETFNGLWCGDWYKGSFISTANIDNFKPERIHHFELHIISREAPLDHVLLCLNDIPIEEIMNSVRKIISEKLNSECSVNFSAHLEDPVGLMKKVLGIEVAEAMKLVEIFSEIILKHDKLTQWKPRVISYGALMIDGKPAPIPVQQVKFGKNHISKDALLTSSPSIFDGIIKKKEWDIFPKVRSNISEVLCNWLSQSHFNWKQIITRRYQLSEEKKYFYTFERIYFLLCYYHSEDLRKLPMEIVKLICSFLPVTYYGCLLFGKQTYSTGRWSWDSNISYLILNPDTHTFEYITVTEGTKWTYLNKTKSEKSGTWKITFDGLTPKIVLQQTEVIITKDDQSEVKKIEREEIEIIDTIDLCKSHNNGGLKMVIDSFGEIAEMSLYELLEIQKGNRELLINCHDVH